jgi:hypothetical protein
MLGQLIDEVVTTRQVRNHVEIDGETPARPGQIRSWLTSFFPVFGVRNEVAYVGLTAIDITERRRAGAAVIELNESLEAKVEERTGERDRLWRNSQDLQIIVDTKGMMWRSTHPWPSPLAGRRMSCAAAPSLITCLKRTFSHRKRPWRMPRRRRCLASKTAGGIRKSLHQNHPANTTVVAPQSWVLGGSPSMSCDGARQIGVTVTAGTRRIVPATNPSGNTGTAPARWSAMPSRASSIPIWLWLP